MEQEMNTVQNTENNEVKPSTETTVNNDVAADNNKINLRISILSIASFVIFWISILIFMLGAPIVYDENLTIVSALNLFLALFSLKTATIYSTLSGAVIAVMYLVILIRLIYIIIEVIKLFVFSLRGDTNEKRGKATIDLYYFVIDTFLTYYILMFTTYILTGSSLNFYSILLISLNIIISLIAAIISPIRKIDENQSIIDSIFDFIKKILIIAAFCLVFSLIAEPVGIELRNGITLLFSGNYNSDYSAWGVIVNIYTYAARPVLIFVSGILLLNLFHGHLKYLFPRKNETTLYSYRLKASTITVLVLVCVIAALDFLFLFSEYNGELAITSASFENWLRVSKNTLIPAILAAIGAVIISSAKGNIKRSPKE